jgi:hypothetical protein
VTPDVETVELRINGAKPIEAELFDGPPGVDARYFVVWTPNDVTGEVVALDASGRELGTAGMCVTLEEGATTGCS